MCNECDSGQKCHCECKHCILTKRTVLYEIYICLDCGHFREFYFNIF